MIITISGTPGSGKSTVAKIVAEKLGLKHYSMGDFQRQIADEKGISIIELGKLEQEDESIDKEVDEKQRKLGEKEDNFVIDSRLGAYFIAHANLKIFLDADEEERARRIFENKREKEKYESVEDTMKKLREREEVNNKRYMEYYSIAYTDKKLYTDTIDTTNITAEEAAEKIVLLAKQKL